VNEWVLAPLGVLVACALWVYAVNQRPRVGGFVWPVGLALSGPVLRPDIDYDGTVVLGAEADFGAIRCRVLVITRGADVTATKVEAARVRVEGTLAVADLLVARKRLDVAGVLSADEVCAPRITLRKSSRATVLVVSGDPKIRRHPGAVVKGFFSERGEMPAVRKSDPDTQARTIHVLEA
jgi:hypothetical protein